MAIGSAAQPAFIEVLRADSSAVEKVVEEIGPNALPALTESLHEKDKHVRIRAMYNIGEIWKHQKLYGKYNRLAMELRAFEAVPALVKAVADEDKNVREAARQALVEMGSDANAAIPDLTKLLQHEDEGVRKEAAKALEELSDARKKEVARKETAELIQGLKLLGKKLQTDKERNERLLEENSKEVKKEQDKILRKLEKR